MRSLEHFQCPALFFLPHVLSHNNVFQASLWYMVHPFTVPPVFDVTVRSNSFKNNSLFGLAQRHNQKYLEMIKDVEVFS
jgi:hypothetical protein